MVTAEQFKSPYYNLKSLISKKGFTQNDIAEKLDMDRSVFNVKINRSNGRDFTLEEAIKISKVLNEKVDYFF